MPTTVLFKGNIAISKKLTLENEEVIGAAFYDAFADKDKLEDFVKGIANGEIDPPYDTKAQRLIDELEL